MLKISAHIRLTGRATAAPNCRILRNNYEIANEFSYNENVRISVVDVMNFTDNPAKYFYSARN